MLKHDLAVADRDIGSLSLSPTNARAHSPMQVGELARSIERFGFYNPILIDEANVIRAGEGRYLAAQKLNLKQVPTIMLRGLSPAQWRALALADNRIAQNATWDEERLRAEIAALNEQQEDVQHLGFSGEELKRLTREIEKATVENGIRIDSPPDEFYISIRGPLARQAESLALLEKAFKKLHEDVEVNIGAVETK